MLKKLLLHVCYALQVIKVYSRGYVLMDGIFSAAGYVNLFDVSVALQVLLATPYIVGFTWFLDHCICGTLMEITNLCGNLSALHVHVTALLQITASSSEHSSKFEVPGPPVDDSDSSIVLEGAIVTCNFTLPPLKKPMYLKFPSAF